ncbi:MAG: DUF1638 domain-containing protein [Pseudomonadota bacterium]
MIDDDGLSERGLPATAGPRDASVLLIACGALAREVLALERANGWRGLALSCLPASLHNRPDRIPEAVRERVRAARAHGYASVFVLYADCGTGGLLDKVCAEEGVERIAGPHCYAFFDGNDAFAARAEEEMGAFYLTDFMVRQFDAIVWRGLGLERHPELRDMYFGHYDRVVYLAQTEDAALTAAAERAAERLGLAFERRFTGYGELGETLAGIAAARG